MRRFDVAPGGGTENRGADADRESGATLLALTACGRPSRGSRRLRCRSSSGGRPATPAENTAAILE